MEAFTSDDAKQILAKYLGIKTEIMEAGKPFPFGSGQCCTITVKEGPKEGTYSVYNDKRVIPHTKK